MLLHHFVKVRSSEFVAIFKKQSKNRVTFDKNCPEGVMGSIIWIMVEIYGTSISSSERILKIR